MFKDLRSALSMLVLMTLLTGLAYPLLVTTLAQAFFPWQANGSLIYRDGQVVGSALIGQAFSDPAYVWGRPSATSAAPYDAANSSGSNLAPSSRALAEAATNALERLRASDPGQKRAVPVDLVTSSASGLDPDISPAAAQWQARRVARARGVPVEAVEALIDRHVEGRAAGLFGEPRVNVLRLNLALDQAWPRR